MECVVMYVFGLPRSAQWLCTVWLCVVFQCVRGACVVLYSRVLCARSASVQCMVQLLRRSLVSACFSALFVLYLRSACLVLYSQVLCFVSASVPCIVRVLKRSLPSACVLALSLLCVQLCG